jgi:hypothetical protein
MRKLIGVGDEASLAQLKRWLLLVDEVAVVHDQAKDWDCRDDNPSLAADLDWLSDRGIVSKVDTHANATVNVQDIKSEEGRVLLIPRAGAASIYLRPGPSTGQPMTVSELLDALQDIVCRLECQTLQRSTDVDAISFRMPSPGVWVSKDLHLVLGDVEHVTINAMPEPSETTPLEAILDFRKDPEARRKFVALRRWMARMAKANTPQRELTDELEWLLHEYETYMQLHKMKLEKGVLESVITGAAGMAEDFVKIKWGELAKIPFSISKRKIDLLESELNAPGREIAYVAHAQSEFGNP